MMGIASLHPSYELRLLRLFSRDIPVFLLEQAEPGIDVAVGHLKQARGAADALVDDAVALRQREDVAPLPADGVVADLAFARPFHHAADRIRRGAERQRCLAGIELHQETVD